MVGFEGLEPLVVSLCILKGSFLKTLCRKISFIMGIGNGIAMPGGFVNTGQLGQTLGMGAMMGITETGWTLGMIV